MAGVQRVAEDGLDAVILDLGLPDVDGAQVLKMIRALSTIPIIVATARDEESEIVRILSNGADDYDVKPDSGVQILARLEAIMRRVTAGSSREPLVVGDLHIDVDSRTTTLAAADLS